MALTASLFRLSVYIFATLGFAYLSSHICQEYFQYPTATYFSLLDTTPDASLPIVIFEFPFKAKVGDRLKDVFSKLSNNITIIDGDVKTSAAHRKASNTFKKYRGIVGSNSSIPIPDSFIDIFGMKISYRMGSFLVEVSPTQDRKFSATDYLDGGSLYRVVVETKFNWTNKERVKLQLSPRSSGTGGYQKISRGFPCIRIAGSCSGEVTYSITLLHL